MWDEGPVPSDDCGFESASGALVTNFNLGKVLVHNYPHLSKKYKNISFGITAFLLTSSMTSILKFKFKLGCQHLKFLIA